MKFYKIGFADKKGSIKIKSIEGFDVLNFINLDNNSVLQNNFTVVNGTKEFDIIQFVNSHCNFGISERVRDMLIDNKVTGCTFIPLKIERIDGNYFGFVVTGLAGEILNREELNNYSSENIEFDLNTWNGEDIFSLKGTRVIVCTEKVKSLFEKIGVSNLEIEDL